MKNGDIVKLQDWVCDADLGEIDIDYYPKGNGVIVETKGGKSYSEHDIFVNFDDSQYLIPAEWLILVKKAHQGHHLTKIFV